MINASIVFEETLAYTGRATSKDAKDFFQELNASSETLVNVAFNEAYIAEPVRLAANRSAGDVGSVLGLASGGFNPTDVGEVLRSSLDELFSSCRAFLDVETSAGDLFFAPELIEFSLEMTENSEDDPLNKLFEEANLSCDHVLDVFYTVPSSYFEESNPQSVLEPFIQMVCRVDGGQILIRRHSSNLESLLAVRLLQETVDSPNYVYLYSERFSGLFFTTEDRLSELKALARGYASSLGMEVLEGEN